MNENNGIMWGRTTRRCRMKMRGKMQVFEVELYLTLEGDRKKAFLLKSKDAVRDIEVEVERMSAEDIEKFVNPRWPCATS